MFYTFRYIARSRQCMARIVSFDDKKKWMGKSKARSNHQSLPEMKKKVFRLLHVDKLSSRHATSSWI